MVLSLLARQERLLGRRMDSHHDGLPTPNMPLCPVCGDVSASVSFVEGGIVGVDCPRCGPFSATPPAARYLLAAQKRRPRVAKRLSTRIRQLNRRTTVLDLRIAQALRPIGRSATDTVAAKSLASWINRRPNHAATEQVAGWLAIANSRTEREFERVVAILVEQGIVARRDSDKGLSLALTDFGVLETTPTPYEGPEPRHSDKGPQLLVCESLSVANFRCFNDEQVLSLRDDQARLPRWTVIIGENGTGKTSLLQLIAGLFPYQPSYYDATDLDWSSYLDEEERDFFPTGAADPELPAMAKLVFRKGRDNPTRMASAVYFRERADDVANLVNAEFDTWTISGGGRRATSSPQSVRGNEDSVPIPPLMAAYGAIRGPGQNGARVESAQPDPRRQLFRFVDLLSPEEQLLGADHRARVDTKSDNPTRLFDLVAAAVTPLLPGVSKLTAEGDDELLSRPRIMAWTLDGAIPVDSLSLGYQTTLTWVVDLMVRMAVYYRRSDTPFSEPAVVLIDEFDLHLHPRWQRDLMSSLEALFPQTQFIITTHSPLIVQGSESVNLVLLKRTPEGVRIVQEKSSIGNWRADQILTSELFALDSLEPPHIAALDARRAELTRKAERTPEETAEMAEIDRLIEERPLFDNPDDEKALEFLRRAAKSMGMQ